MKVTRIILICPACAEEFYLETNANTTTCPYCKKKIQLMNAVREAFERAGRETETET